MENGREAGFRDVNDAIRGLARSGGSADELWEFFCECDDFACRALIQLTLTEFDKLRTASPAEPILSGHHA
jgi:hypothetical protein